MFTGRGVEYLAGIRPKALACRVKAKSAVLGAIALVVTLGSISAAQAQCSATGSLPVPQTVAMAVAGVSASVNALVTSINTVNTAFLTQSNAFIGSPPNPQPDQEGGGVWDRGGHLSTGTTSTNTALLTQSSAFIGSPPNPQPDQESGGVWARGVGGHLSTSTTSTTENINFGGPLSASINCDAHTLEDFAGVQIGTDIAKLNVNGWNVHIGSTVGYLGAKTQDATPQGLNPGPTFRDNLQIPFAGVYAAASYGSFRVDGQIRGDFFENEVSDDNHGLFGQQFNARSISLTGNVAYNQNLRGWFVEPSAGIIWSRTQVDPLNVPGTMVRGLTTAGPSGIPIPPWLLTVNDIESTLGRVGVSVGTAVDAGNVVLQPFASASVFHEFQGGAVGSLTTNFSSNRCSPTDSPLGCLYNQPRHLWPIWGGHRGPSHEHRLAQLRAR